MVKRNLFQQIEMTVPAKKKKKKKKKNKKYSFFKKETW